MNSKKYQDLEQELKSISLPKERINKMVEMAYEVRNYDLEQAMEWSDTIFELSEEINYKPGIGRAYNLRGWCNWQQGNYDEGLKNLKKGEHLAQESKDDSLLARINNNFGHIYRDTGELGTALSYFEYALKLNTKVGDVAAQAVNLSSIAYIHYDLYNYDTALEFALRALPILENAESVHRSNLLHNILGNIYFKREEFKNALYYFDKNLQGSESSSAIHALALNGIGKVNYKMHEIEQALNFLHQGLDEADDMGIPEAQISCRYYLALIEKDASNYVLAQKRLLAALDLAEQFKRRHDEMSLHETLSELYDQMGNIPKAFNHLKLYEKLKEEIFQQTTLNKLSSLKLRQELELANKEKEVAEKTARLKQQFLANMSHEIRTPMNAIVGITQLLLDKNPRPDQLKYLNAINQSSDNLLVIINDILDIAKIEAGKMNIEKLSFILKEVVEAVKEILSFKAQEKGINLQTYIDPKIPNLLLGDPTRLHQIILNLAGNAVKFTEQGTVKIEAFFEKQVGQNYIVKIDVSDTGIGIAQENLNYMFESFTQASSDTTRKFGGTGLGLAISKQLTELMQGQISVKSALGKGSCFTVTIPFPAAKATPDQQIEKQQKSDWSAQLAHVKVLLVEDNEFNQLVAIDTLKALIPSIQLDVANNGEEAVRKVRQNSYDILLMDINMPVMDGMMATQQIRALSADKNAVKIIAMTANVLAEDVQKYFDLGMNEYVSKPFQQAELLRKMAQVLQHRAPDNIAEPSTQQGGTTFIPIPDKVCDMNFLKQFTQNDPVKQKKYIMMFLDNAPKLLVQVQEGLAKKDYEMIKIAAHSLKPQMSYMGVPEELSQVFLLEQSAGQNAHYKQVPALIENLQRVCKKAFEELNSLISN